MSIATQIERLQGVRDQIRTKMVSLGLSENTDLLQNLADDLDGVNKVSPTNNGTTDPGSSYTNVDTLSRSTSTRYIKVPKGYNDADRKFTVSGVANGSYSASVASHTTSNATASSSVAGSVTNIATTTKPSGTDGTNYYTITPKLTTASGSSKATGKATIDTAGYLAAGNKSSSESSKSVGVTATQGGNYYLKAGSYSASVSSHTTSNATASSSVTGSITNVATSTKPTSGTDGSDYFTITPKLTTASGSSKATGKATIGAAGYLATGSTTSSESSKTVGVTATQGGSYYLKKGSYSASVSSHTTSNATAGSSVTGTVTNIATTTKPAGTDGTDYYTITPKLTTGSGSSKAIGKAAVDTAGYLATGNTTSTESSKSVGVTASQGDSYYLKASSVTKEDPGTSYVNKATVTPSTSAQYVKVTAGYLPNSKITVNAIPSPYFNTSGVTATAGTVLKDYKFVNSSGTTVTGTIATATSSNVSGSVSGGDPGKITLTAAKTSGSSSTTATAKAIVTKGLYTGSSNIEKDLTSKTITATAEATLAGTNGAIELTAGTSAFTKTSTADYSNGFITSVKVNPTPSDPKEYTPTMKGDTISPAPGKLLSSVAVKGVPYFSVTLPSSMWGNSGSNVTAGKYYYNVSNEHITASNNLYVMPNNASAAQSFGVYAYSQSRTSGAKTGALQFRAMERPTSDLTYTIYYLN